MCTVCNPCGSLRLRKREDMPRSEANFAATAATWRPVRWTPPAGSTSVNNPTIEFIWAAKNYFSFERRNGLPQSRTSGESTSRRGTVTSDVAKEIIASPAGTLFSPEGFYHWRRFFPNGRRATYPFPDLPSSNKNRSSPARSELAGTCPFNAKKRKLPAFDRYLLHNIT